MRGFPAMSAEPVQARTKLCTLVASARPHALNESGYAVLISVRWVTTICHTTKVPGVAVQHRRAASLLTACGESANSAVHWSNSVQIAMRRSSAG